MFRPDEIEETSTFGFSPVFAEEAHESTEDAPRKRKLSPRQKAQRRERRLRLDMENYLEQVSSDMGDGDD